MKAGKAVLLCLLAWILVPGGKVACQEGFELTAKERVKVPSEYAHILTGTFQCDSDSNLYVRPYDPELTGPVLKISADGQRVTRVTLGSVPGFDHAELRDFAVTPEGQVYFLAPRLSAEKQPENYVLKFDKEGKPAGSVRVEGPYLLLRIGVFPSGGVFLAGWNQRSASANPHEPRRPFAGIVDSQGRLVKDLAGLKEDIQFRKEDLAAKTPKESDAAVLEYERTISGSQVRSGEDGNFYLMRYAPEGPVLVLSPSGEVLRVSHLQPPRSARLVDIKLARGRLAAVFLRKPDQQKGE